MSKRIIVVGGGIAGLTAAYTLRKDGFDVEVLERNETAGGRMRSERQGAFVVDRVRRSSPAATATCAPSSTS